MRVVEEVQKSEPCLSPKRPEPYLVEAFSRKKRMLRSVVEDHHQIRFDQFDQVDDWFREIVVPLLRVR